MKLNLKDDRIVLEMSQSEFNHFNVLMETVMLLVPNCSCSDQKCRARRINEFTQRYTFAGMSFAPKWAKHVEDLVTKLAKNIMKNVRK